MEIFTPPRGAILKIRKKLLICYPCVPGNLAEWPAPPIGLAYVSASLKQAGFEVYTLSLVAKSDKDTYSRIQEALNKNNIEVILCGDLVVNYAIVKEVIDSARKIKPDIITVIGGNLVTYSPCEAMTIIDNADYGVIGEGEITTCELITALEGDRDISTVNGLIYRHVDMNGESVLKFTPERQEIVDLDTVPFPDYEGMEILEAQYSKRMRYASVTTSRSCPFNCTFCSHSGGKTYRQRSLDKIFEEIEYLVTKYQINHAVFSDELFAIDKRRVYEFCERIKAYNLLWICSMRISKFVTLDLLEKMKESGCVEIIYGLESADNRILKSMRKQTTVKEMERVLEATNSAGIHTHGNLIFGDAEETLETVNNSISWAFKHRHLITRFEMYPITLYPGSYLYDNAVRNGYIKDTVQFIKDGCPVINISQLTDSEYQVLVSNTLPDVSFALNECNFVKDISADKEKWLYQVRWGCPKCGEGNALMIEPRDIVKSANSFQCEKCGYVSPFYHITNTYIGLIENKLKTLLLKKKCAIWGMGALWNYMIKNSTALQDESIPYTLIDSDPIRHNNKPAFRKVYLPEHLNTESYDYIVCMLSNEHYSTVEPIIRQNYKNCIPLGICEFGLIELQ